MTLFRLDLLRFASTDAATSYLKYLDAFKAAIQSNAGRGDTPIFWLAWREFYGAARRWVSIVLAQLEIPPKEAKAVELAARATRIDYKGKSPKSGILPWYEKNSKYFDVLARAVSWGPRESHIEMGPFRVHDTMASSPKEIQRSHEIVALALKKARTISALNKTTYGELYLVGKIERSNWAAWYFPGKDIIFLRPKISGVTEEDSARHLIHELAHRWWHKFLPDSAKKEWVRHFHHMKNSVTGGLPEEGFEFPSWFTVNRKQIKVGPRVPEGIQLLDAATGKKVAVVEFLKMIKWMIEFETMAAFPTPYAATSPEEFFAEAVSLKAMGRLDAATTEVIDSITS